MKKIYVLYDDFNYYKDTVPKFHGVYTNKKSAEKAKLEEIKKLYSQLPDGELDEDDNLIYWFHIAEVEFFDERPATKSNSAKGVKIPNTEVSIKNGVKTYTFENMIIENIKSQEKEK